MDLMGPTLGIINDPLTGFLKTEQSFTWFEAEDWDN